MPSAVRCMHESLSINKYVFKSPYLFSLSQFLPLCQGAQKLGYMVSKAQPWNPDATRCQKALCPTAVWARLCRGTKGDTSASLMAAPRAKNGHGCLEKSATVASGGAGTPKSPSWGSCGVKDKTLARQTHCEQQASAHKLLLCRRQGSALSTGPSAGAVTWLCPFSGLRPPQGTCGVRECHLPLAKGWLSSRGSNRRGPAHQRTPLRPIEKGFMLCSWLDPVDEARLGTGLWTAWVGGQPGEAIPPAFTGPLAAAGHPHVAPSAAPAARPWQPSPAPHPSPAGTAAPCSALPNQLSPDGRK